MSFQNICLYEVILRYLGYETQNQGFLETAKEVKQDVTECTQFPNKYALGKGIDLWDIPG